MVVTVVQFNTFSLLGRCWTIRWEGGSSLPFTKASRARRGEEGAGATRTCPAVVAAVVVEAAVAAVVKATRPTRTRRTTPGSGPPMKWRSGARRGLPIPGTLHYQDLDWDEQEDEPQQVSAGSTPCRKMAAKATAAAKKAAKAKKKAKAAAKKKKKEQAKKKKACDDDEDEQPKKRKPAANVDGSGPASFARRNQPQREFPAKKWQAIKDSFMKHVRPLVSSAPGLHEAGCSQDGLYSRVCFHAGLYLIYRKPYKNPTNDI